jgi:peptidoglycan/LPS O-acetylase OafA/YrhL
MVSRAKKAFRADIQALRAIAVASVVAFHLWPRLLPGGFIGVDVFFVISGFLITGHILKEVADQTFSVIGFWARRIRRLLPAALLVILITTIALAFIGSDSDQVLIFGQLQPIASAFYFENWNLAASAVDYLNQGRAESPFQHYWSLSAEEQFYLAWPLIIALLAWLGAKAGKSKVIGRVALALAALTIGSLVYSIVLTDADPKVAYFSTFTRVWEFGLGALLAFVPNSKSLSNNVRNLAALIGLATIAVTAFDFSSQLPFPSFWAAVPVLGAAAVIWAKVEQGKLQKIFEFKPIQFLGDISYSTYLWHWPIIILVPMATHSGLTTVQKVLIVLFTLGIAALTRKLVEKPFLRLSDAGPTSNRKTFIFAAIAGTLIVVITAAGFVVSQRRLIDRISELENQPLSSACFGASARQPDGSLCTSKNGKAAITPDPSLAVEDTPSLGYPNCKSTRREQSNLDICPLGYQSGAVSVLLVGDSHAAQYRSSVDLAAQALGLRAESIVKGGCAFSLQSRVNDSVLTNSCKQWVANVLNRIRQKHYDLVITSSLAGVSWAQSGSSEPSSAGFSKLWKEIVASGSNVLAIKDNPKPIGNLVRCLESNGAKAVASCSNSKSKAFSDDPLPKAVASLNNDRVQLADFDHIFCNKVCEPVIGNVLVYRDDNHLTNTFAKSMQFLVFKAIAQIQNIPVIEDN